jgi:flavin reductase (DIM6/NTAB) family NADH-FMN oxidoreductase RutF
VTTFDPSDLLRRDIAALMNAIVAPRPIAWVSTLDSTGTANLAPFSFYNAFSTAPPTIAIGPGSRTGVNKDSLCNIRASGEFVVNAVNEELAHHANRSSGEFPPDVDEWVVAGVTPVTSDDVSPPRVRESPASFECRVFQIVDLGRSDAPTNSVVIGRITRIHVADHVLDGTTPDAAALALVGRAGGDIWVRTTDRFVLRRPQSIDPTVVLTEDIRIQNDGRPSS